MRPIGRQPPLRGHLPAEYVSLHRHFSHSLENVKHIQHDSRTFAYESLGWKPDVIFIDGDHHYESVRADTENAFRCLAEGGTIIWHDYAFSPETIRWTVLAGILDGCQAGQRERIYQVSNTMCAIYTKKEVITSVLNPFSTPDKYFSVQISARNNQPHVA